MDRPGLAGRLADRLIDSPLVPLIVLAALVMGAYGLTMTPREDRPDIEVPTALITIPFPGAGVERVDELVARPVGSWAGQLERVVEVNTVASDDAALIEVEFAAGISDATAYAELRELMERNRSRLPPGTERESIRTVGEELFTGLMLTLSSAELGTYQLRRLATELAARLEAVEGVRAVTVHGGQPRELQVLPRAQDLAAHGIGLVQVFEAIEAASLRLPTEPLRGDRTRQVRVGAWPGSVTDLEGIQVGMGPAGVIHLSDVANVVDGPAPDDAYSTHWQRGETTEVAAVSLAVTSIPNRNISAVTTRTLERLEALRPQMLPAEVQVSIAYDAGRAATETVMSVLENFFIATVVVVIIILIGLGWRAAAGVSLLIPAILSIVPFAYFWIGFSLNPVSIAAMILAIGLVADDTVIIMENIRRHFQEAGERSRELVIRAVDEVGNPTILAVFLIVATLLPTAFISGEMGQYTRAIPVGASLAILFSLTIALTVTPFVAYRLLRVPRRGKGRDRHDAQAEAPGQDPAAGQGSARMPTGPLADSYRWLLQPFFRHAWVRWSLYAALVALLVGSIAMVAFRAVQLTLVPFLDREVFVVEIELPPGSPLENTLQASASVGRALRQYPEIEAYTVFAGSEGPLLMPRPGPPDLPSASSHRASIYALLPHEDERVRLSYQIGRELADQLPTLLSPFAGRAWIRHIPSGPSNDNGLQAEIYGPDPERQRAVADTIAGLLEKHEAAHGIERFPKPAAPELRLTVDQTRASAQGVLPARAAAAVQMGLTGRTATGLDLPRERRPVPVVVRLPESERQWREDLAGLYIQNEAGEPVPLRDILDFDAGETTPHRHRKNQLPVVYVAAAINRDRSQPVSVQRDIVAALQDQDIEPPAIRWLGLPESGSPTTLFWGGEWQMTQEVYRDLALAGVGVLLVIYTLLAAWFGSYVIPLLIMMPIPLVFIGVIPAHWAMGLDIAGLGVLGIIALAGIVVRNAVLLVDFAQQRIESGMGIQDALISAGALRTRPILLTAGTVAFGSGALIFEPALKPLGLTLVSGVVVATVLTLILIPSLYFHVFGTASGPARDPEHREDTRQ
ncbi:efflux RND transporter permease subunit [Thioalkalivibrio sp.]|uniref:efflux RND transporter permease subunit n=1 Tax=Thioalkalivibrio sp. TaxID=2093813 RepID=UPI00397571AA